MLRFDLDSLRCFDAAATTRNFRAAARRVHLSAAAFSDRLRRLEGELEAPLFVRTTRKVELSEAGRRLLEPARELLQRADALGVLAKNGPAAPAGYQLTLGTRFELGQSWLCPSLGAIERAHPERRLHLYNADSPDLMPRLERGDLDAVVASVRLTSPRLSYATLHAEEYRLVSTTRCLSRAGEVSTVRLLDVSQDLPLFRYFLDALPDAAPWDFEDVEYLGGIGNIRLRLLSTRNTIAVLPEYFVRKDLAAGRLVRLMPKVKLRSDAFRLVWRTGHPRTDELVQLAGELRAIPLR